MDLEWFRCRWILSLLSIKKRNNSCDTSEASRHQKALDCCHCSSWRRTAGTAWPTCAVPCAWLFNWFCAKNCYAKPWGLCFLNSFVIVSSIIFPSFSHRPTRWIPLNPHETRQNPNSSQSNPPMLHHTSCISPFTMISHHISKSSTLPYIYNIYTYIYIYILLWIIQKIIRIIKIRKSYKSSKNQKYKSQHQKITSNPQKIHAAQRPRQPLPPPPALRPKPQRLWQRPLRLPPGILGNLLVEILTEIDIIYIWCFLCYFHGRANTWDLLVIEMIILQPLVNLSPS